MTILRLKPTIPLYRNICHGFDRCMTIPLNSNLIPKRRSFDFRGSSYRKTILYLSRHGNDPSIKAIKPLRTITYE